MHSWRVSEIKVCCPSPLQVNKLFQVIPFTQRKLNLNLSMFPVLKCSFCTYWFPGGFSIYAIPGENQIYVFKFVELIFGHNAKGNKKVDCNSLDGVVLLCCDAK